MTDTKLFQRTLWLAVGLSILALGFRCITEIGIRGDARQNLQMAFNLERHGIVSLDEAPPFEPSMFREPIPVFVTAAVIALVEAARGPGTVEQYSEGPRVKLLKYQDLGWLLAIYAGSFWAASLFCSGFYVRLLAATLACVPYLLGSRNPGISVDALYSDVAAAAILIVASGLLARAFSRSSVAYSLLSGACFAVLALTKAAFLYVFAGVLCAYAVYLLFARRGAGTVIGHVGMMALAFAAVTFPWMYRNHVNLGSYQIAERGGDVLYTRAVKDMMTAQEYRGAFYVWAPTGRAILGPLLGFSRGDDDGDGPLRRLNRSNDSTFHLADKAAEEAGKPEAAVSYFRQARAERVKVLKKHQALGDPNASVAADAEIRQHAITIIREHPWRHLALTLPVLWRGAILQAPLFALCFGYAMRRRRYDLALFATPAIGMIAFYALLSHFIPRYSKPALPVAAVLVVVAAKSWWDTHRNRRPVANKIDTGGAISEIDRADSLLQRGGNA